MKTTSETKPAGLVGRYFHIWDDEGSNIARQGHIVAQIDPTHYLVQFYDWIEGERSTLHIYTLDAMTMPAPEQERAGAWQFYENAEHWAHWMKYKAPKPWPKSDARTPGP
jgi:hypothetical protein